MKYNLIPPIHIKIIAVFEYTWLIWNSLEANCPILLPSVYEFLHGLRFREFCLFCLLFLVLLPVFSSIISCYFSYGYYGHYYCIISRIVFAYWLLISSRCWIVPCLNIYYCRQQVSHRKWWNIFCLYLRIPLLSIVSSFVIICHHARSLPSTCL